MIDLKFLNDEGFYYPVDVINTTEATKIEEKILNLYSSGNLRKYQSHLYYEFMYNLTQNERLISLFKKIVGPNPIVWNTSIFVKDPDDRKEMFDHQDSVYDGVISDHKYTVYLAINKNNQETGSLYFYNKSHLNGCLPHITYNNPTNMHGSHLEINHNTSVYKKSFVDLAAGQASVHHMQTIHGSHKNFSNDYRISIAFRLTNNSATFLGTPHHGIIYNESNNNLNLKKFVFSNNHDKRIKMADEDLSIFYKNYNSRKTNSLT